MVEGWVAFWYMINTGVEVIQPLGKYSEVQVLYQHPLNNVLTALEKNAPMTFLVRKAK